MCPMIDNPASCEIRNVISFLHAKNINAVEIHHELCMVYGWNVMTQRTVRHWCRLFKDEWTNVHDDKECCQSSVVSDNLIQCWPKDFWKTVLHNFRNVRISTNFMGCFYEIITVKTRVSQVLHKMGSDNAHRCTQNEENGFGFDFLGATPQRWWWIPQSHRTSNMMKPGFH